MKEKFNNFMENKFLPIMSKIAANKYLNFMKILLMHLLLIIYRFLM